MQSSVLIYKGNNRNISAIIQKLADMKTISKESRKAIDFLREKNIKPDLEISKYIDVESLYPYNRIINGSEVFETTQGFFFRGNYFEFEIIANFKYKAYHASETYTDPKERRKVHNWILGVVESEEQRKERLNNELDTKERYQIKKTSQRQLKGLKI